MIKERPILFSTSMVQAILEGKKTQTRRIVRPQPIDSVECDGNIYEGKHKGYVKVDGHPNWQRQFAWEFCKYEVGDILWVREKFIHLPAEYEYAISTAHPINPAVTYYAADEKEALPGPWKPSIHMPKELSRIRLQITDIRVERLQDISEEDAKAEGANTVDCFYTDGSGEGYSSWREGFAKIWRKINGEESWNQNPWVWVIEFKNISNDKSK